MTVQPDIRFYDTSSLLLAREKLFNQEEKFLISSVTLQELEHIKTSNKDSDIKYTARLITKLLAEHPDKYQVIIHDTRDEDELTDNGLEATNDLKILIDAIRCNEENPWIDRIIFVTNDLCLKNIANWYFGNMMIESIEEDNDDYTGYKEIIATEE